MVAQYAENFGGWNRTWWDGNSHISAATGHFRWSEAIFEVNEKIACLGVSSPAYPDPYLQQDKMALIPFKSDAKTEEAMEKEDTDWSTWDKWAWQDLLAKTPQVLLTDKKK